MAIFIVDQLSLNSDLPLDIRYVPNGGSYLDVSAYWYPGMQVYQTSDQKIWYADNNLQWHQVGSAAQDASIAQLYQFYTDLSTYVGEELLRIDASFGELYRWDLSQDASIVNLKGWDLSQDASISALRINIADVSSRVFDLENAVDLINLWQASTDASIANLKVWDLSQDASINNLRNIDNQIKSDVSTLWAWEFSQDSSINSLKNVDTQIKSDVSTLWAWELSQDASIVNLKAWDLSQDASIVNLRSNIETSLGLYVKKAGDTMTGALNINAGGLNVSNDVSIFGKLYVAQNAAIGGDLVINGSLYVVNVGSIDVSTAYIELNTGLTGAPPSTLQSGIIVNRGTENPYIFVYDESRQTFRIGISQLEGSSFADASTQAVATREDSPVPYGIAYWNETLSRFDTSIGFTLNDVKNHFAILDASTIFLYGWEISQDASISQLRIDLSDVSIRLAAIGIADISTRIDTLETSVIDINNLLQIHEASIGSLTNWNVSQDASIHALETSIGYLDSSIKQLFDRKDTSVLGAMNIGDASGHIYAGITADGSLRFKGIQGSGPAIVSETSDLIVISLDPSFGGEVNTASNIPGSDASIFNKKVGEDLQFKGLKTLDPSTLIITSDASFVYIDLSVNFISNASFGGLTDVSITSPLKTHQIAEFDASASLWKNTNNIWWDISLGTTTDDLGGIPAGTDLSNLTLKQILFKILYEYQKPTLVIGSNPVAGIYEKGLPSTQFSTIDVSWYSTNANYPLALLNNVHIAKTGEGSIYDASLGLVPSASGSYNDLNGIINWGGANRTISYNVTIDDNQPNSQPAIGLSESFTFWYRQYWGMVPGTTTLASINSAMIKGLADSSIRGELELSATFDNSTGGFVKYLFAYPDTIAAPDNFGTLTQILDQNDFDITGSFETRYQDVSVGTNNVRYRIYLLKNKINTPIFHITFKF